MRILAVDDDDNDLVLLDRAIKRSKLPIDFSTIRNPTEALPALEPPNRPGGFDFILLDVRMNVIDGHELLAAIRRRPELTRLPILMFSNSDRRADIERARELGADSYFVKPVDINVLTELLKDLYGRWIRQEVPACWPDIEKHR